MESRPPRAAHRLRPCRRTAIAWCAWCLAMPFAAQAQTAATEAAVKAAYVYRFLPYIDWPEGTLGAPGRAVQIGVLGAEPVAAALTEIVAGREVNGRPVAVRVLKPGERPDGLHAVFVGTGVPLRAVAERVGAQPVLVITEGGLEPGAMLSLVKIGEKVRFEAAPLQAERAGLKLGARLLAVAERVATP